MKFIQLGLSILFCSASVVTYAQAPDNTKTNKGDAKTGAVTADQQKSNAGDREMTRAIRKAIVADKSLSTYAHNVKIISQNGVVTLKGPVKSEEEKKTVIAKAVEVAGSSDKVTDKITIAQ